LPRGTRGFYFPILHVQRPAARAAVFPVHALFQYPVAVGKHAG
jgi:hypothetical protein